jgi:alpha-tubulin suppressor-like RCC1 family protein
MRFKRVLAPSPSTSFVMLSIAVLAYNAARGAGPEESSAGEDASAQAIWTWGGNMFAEVGHSPGLPWWPPGGRQPPQHIPDLKQPVEVAAGYFHTLVLDADGRVWTWGSNDNGELGRGSQSQTGPPGRVPDLENVSAIAGGQYFSVAVLDDGSIWTWGANRFGQLGDGSTEDRSRPVQVQGIDDVIDVAAGRNFVIALKRDGAVWGWGYNGNGQLGDGTKVACTKPVKMANVDHVKAIACCDASTIVLKKDGTVWGCGAREFIVYGGKDTEYSQVLPAQVEGLSDIDAIACGYSHRLAIKNDGTVWAWGYGLRGQLGVGERTSGGRAGSGPNSIDAAQVPGLPAIKAVAGGLLHSLAVDEEGTLWAWGTNQNGQFGVKGPPTLLVPMTSLVPMKIPEISGIEKIACGVHHVVSIRSTTSSGEATGAPP